MRRTRIGDFSVTSAVSLEEAQQADSLEPLLRPPVEALVGWRRRVIDAEAITRVARGQSIRPEAEDTSETLDQSIALIDSDGTLLALARAEVQYGDILVQPYRVFIKS